MASETEENLGSSDRTFHKMAFIAFFFFVFAYLFFEAIKISGDIGEVYTSFFKELVQQSQKGVIFFYILLGLPAFGILLFDFATNKGVTELIDTVTHEEHSLFGVELTFFRQLMIAGIFSLIFIFYITTTGQAFVQAPAFSFLDTAIGNAFLSGILGGVVETLFFFIVAQPIIYAFSYRITNSQILSILSSVILATLFFTGFHTIVYQYNEAALYSVFFFGFLNSLLTILLRSNITNISIHLTNNFLVRFLAITSFAVILV